MRALDLLKTYRKIINPPYKVEDLPVIIGTIIILIAIPFTVIAALTTRELKGRAAGVGTMYLSPSTQSVNHGAPLSVQILENSGTEAVNAVQANLTYDPAKLDFVGIDASGSAFTVEYPSSGGGGSVSIARTTAGTTVTGVKLVATVNFQAKIDVTGTTTISFAAGSAIIRVSDYTDILGSTTGGTYTIVDPPPYNVAITSPANNSVIKGTSVSVQATAEDDLAVTKVEFYVDSEASPRSTVTASPYQYTLNTLSPVLSDGAHTIKAKAYDASSSTTATINVVVDNNAPTNVSITAPAANAYVRQTITIQTSPADNPGSGIASVEFYIGGSLKSTDTTSPYLYSWNTTSGYPDGSYALYVKAYDNAANVTTSPTINVTVDNTAPSITISSPTTGAYLKGSVSATASPVADTNLLNVEFSRGATLVCTITASPYTCANILTTSNSDGSYTLYAKANDRAGNSTTASVNVTYDNTAPSPPSNLAATPASSTQINLSWTAGNDTTSGIAGYDVYRGGTKVNPSLVTTTSYSDTGLAVNTNYCYTVKAIDRSSNVSTNSNQSCATTRKTGDLNGDGYVNIIDASILASKWGTNDPVADLNHDGTVNIIDASILAANWGT